MGRQVRRVPPDWQHPVKNGRYKPLRQLDMPHWKNGETTHVQMYETASDGTPLSPVMETPESLARWLVDHEIAAFAGQTASYEAWLMVAQGRTVVSSVITPQSLVSNAKASDHPEGAQTQQPDAFSRIDARKSRTKTQSRTRE